MICTAENPQDFQM